MEINQQIAVMFASGAVILVLGLALTWFAVLFSLFTSALFGRILNDTA